MLKKWLSCGSTVRTGRLGSTEGWRIKSRHMRRRRQGQKGIVLGPAFGHRGEVIMVEHGEGDVAPYHVDELSPA
jgi:hypothetical protein